ncbi:heavy-metal-associated domain-containing protein [Marixanthomonas ophiurae]|uniref:Copper chaperone n=1 Tax=Marixanthomonas ophiurae TaxID=387659 RepID=A0A3E1QCF9_9FLAO|nr:heavy-metal-associated domain-containing protein [Marixanthomonas ophiurae]RFN59817.1 copper chaperone [Marixanthomonas ophiurae]
MKTAISILILLITTVTFAQNKNARTSLEVDGVCGMCKERIEKASIKTKGVKSAIWDVQTHELKLIYNEKKTNLDAIKENILAVGHDVEELKATNEAYNSVHPCCKYRDEAIKDDHKGEGEKEGQK